MAFLFGVKRYIFLIMLLEGCLLMMMFYFYLLFFQTKKESNFVIVDNVSEVYSRLFSSKIINSPDFEISKEGRRLLSEENQKKRIFIMFSTRFELFKLFPIIQELRKSSKFYETFLVYTGEYKTDIVPTLNSFDLTIHMSLNIVGTNISDVYIKAFHNADVLLKIYNPHVVYVSGESIGSLASATAAYFNKIPIAHLEAGIRSKNLFLENSFPFEMTRKTIGMLCNFCFVPTLLTSSRLLEEGVAKERIFVTGNTGIDSLNWVLWKFESNFKSFIAKTFPLLGKRKIIYVSFKKKKEYGRNIVSTCESIVKIANLYARNVYFIVFVHPNEELEDSIFGMLNEVKNIKVIEPFSIQESIGVLKNSLFAITDERWIEEIGPSLGIPLLLLKEKTELIEGTYGGSSVLIGNNKNKLAELGRKLIVEERFRDELGVVRYPFGKAGASKKIITVTNHFFLKKNSLPSMNYHFHSDTKESFLNEKDTVEPGSIGVIVTVWKRTHTMKIIDAIMAQTIKPSEVWLWQNERHVEIDDVLKKYPEVHLIRSSKNLKFHGRFSLPLLMRTEYVAIFDDDLVCGDKWFENCIRVVNKYNAVAGGNGRRITPGVNKYWYSQEYFREEKEDVEVDFIGHIWFFRREWIKYFWIEPVPTFQTGEDISFCASLQMHGGIRSFVPGKQDDDRYNGHLEKFGDDKAATWRTDKSVQQRERIKSFVYWRKRGYSLYFERENVEGVFKEIRLSKDNLWKRLAFPFFEYWGDNLED